MGHYAMERRVTCIPYLFAVCY